MCHPERRAVRRPGAEGQFSTGMSLLDETSRIYLASLIERIRPPVDYWIDLTPFLPRSDEDRAD